MNICTFVFILWTSDVYSTIANNGNSFIPSTVIKWNVLSFSRETIFNFVSTNKGILESQKHINY